MKKLSVLIAVLLAGVNGFASPQAGKYFDHIIIVIFENTDYADAMAQPFFKQLADSGANFSSMLALAHPSQGNYIALASGDLNGVKDDGKHDVDVKNVVDLLEAKGLTWKVYAEDYPGNCYTGSKSGGYVRKHNPFISFLDIQKDPTRCAKIVNADQFDSDSANGTLPNYVFYIPNMDNDGHDTGVGYADKWYSGKFGPFLADARLMANTILLSTFDESGGGSPNQIYTSIVGPMVKAIDLGSNYAIPSLLRLVEDNWDLGDLGKKDHTAEPVQGIWK